MIYSVSRGRAFSCHKKIQFPILFLIATIFFCLNQPAYSDQVTYTYDDLGRLTSAQYADGYNIVTINYDHDDTGNVQEKQVSTVIQDSDGDQIPDAWETQYGLDPNDATDADADTDGDGLTNLQEYQYGTNPTIKDSDGDGFSDGEEVAYGSDPADASSHPSAEPVPAVGPIGMIILFLSLFSFGVLRSRQSKPRSFGRENSGTVAAVFLAVTILFHCTHVSADTKGPGWYNGKGEAVTPEQADAYFAKAETLSGTMALLPETTTAVEATPEIIELARSLQHDPKLIYEYVRNHVDYVPYFGSLKGAAMTYFDGAGNDFDQASLMITLLTESGYQAQYVYGRMLIPYYGGDDNQDMQHWLSVNANAALILQVLYNGGIPADTYGSYCRINRVWVRAVIDGNTYIFDPAFKTYETTSGINLSDSMGYNRSSLLSAAGGTLGTDYIEDMNEANLNSLLTIYSGNLSTFIRNNYPNASMEEIIGGREIIPQYLDELPASSRFAIFSQNTPWDEIPDEYSHTITIRHGGIEITKDIANLGGKRLSLTYQDTVASTAVTALSTDSPMLLTNTDKERSAVLLEEPSSVEMGRPADLILSPDVQVPVPDIKGSGTISTKGTSSQSFGRLYPSSVGSSSSSVTWGPSAPSSNTVTVQLVVSLTSNPQRAYTITAGAGTHNLAPGQGVNVTVQFSNSGQSAGTKTGQLMFQ